MFAPILAAALSVTSQAPGTSWETVISREGQFVVEMPARPNFNRSMARTGRGGRIAITILGCDTPGGLFLAYKIDFPTPILKGIEDAYLDDQRDDFAREYNGKVVTEKKAKLETGQPGRDFTIRGRRDDGPGTVMIRVRKFVAKNAIYALLVASAPDRELPDEAGRFLGSLTLGTKPDQARAHRNPAELDPVGKELKGWGIAVDPDEDCRFKPKGDAWRSRCRASSTTSTPTSQSGTPRASCWTSTATSSPPSRSVGEFRPGANSTNPKSIPCNGGGLFIWNDGDNYIRLERMAGLRKGKVNTFSIFEERRGGPPRRPPQRRPAGGHRVPPHGPHRQPDRRRHQPRRQGVGTPEADRREVARPAEGRPGRHQLRLRPLLRPVRGIHHQQRQGRLLPRRPPRLRPRPGSRPGRQRPEDQAQGQQGPLGDPPREDSPGHLIGRARIRINRRTRCVSRPAGRPGSTPRSDLAAGGGPDRMGRSPGTGFWRRRRR